MLRGLRISHLQLQLSLVYTQLSTDCEIELRKQSGFENGLTLGCLCTNSEWQSSILIHLLFSSDYYMEFYQGYNGFT